MYVYVGKGRLPGEGGLRVGNLSGSRAKVQLEIGYAVGGC